MFKVRTRMYTQGKEIAMLGLHCQNVVYNLRFSILTLYCDRKMRQLLPCSIIMTIVVNGNVQTNRSVGA